MITRFRLFIVGIIPLLLIAGCGRRVSVTNNTFADYQAIPYGFASGSIFAIEPVKDQHELFGKEITHKIKTLLQERGYRVAPTEKAQYLITSSLRMTASKVTVQVPHYAPGQEVLVKGCRHTEDDDQYYEETQQTAGSVTYVNEEQTVFDHNLQLSVYALYPTKDGTTKELVWQGAATVRGPDSDERNILDYLLVSAFKYFGKNTKKHVVTDVSDSQKEMRRIRK